MSKQWQIRRGTTDENDAFTGAVGEITMDTEKKAIRIHDGSTQGGIKIPSETTADYVVEWQMPASENNYTWYRKYRSGWIEQGGYLSGSGAGVTVSLPVFMADGNYTVTFGNTSGNYEQIMLTGRTTTTFSAKISKGTGNVSGCWQISGIAE